MLRKDEDIIGRLGLPLWWDGTGAPRYVPFHPEHTGIYNAAVGLLTIACQDCARGFSVALEFERYRIVGGEIEQYTRPTRDGFDWGEPPPHDCTGDKMNSMTISVLEWWERPRCELFRIVERASSSSRG